MNRYTVEMAFSTDDATFSAVMEEVADLLFEHGSVSDAMIVSSRAQAGPATIKLPRLAGSKSAARRLAAMAGDLRGRDVTIDTRELKSAPPSFTGQLIAAILEQGPASVEVSPAHPNFPRTITVIQT